MIASLYDGSAVPPLIVKTFSNYPYTLARP